MSVQLALLFLLGAAMFLGLVALTIASAGAVLIWLMAGNIYALRRRLRARKRAPDSGQRMPSSANGGHANAESRRLSE